MTDNAKPKPIHELFTPEEGFRQFQETFDPTDEDGGLPMLWVCNAKDEVTIMALATGGMPMQQVLMSILPRFVEEQGRPARLMLVSESWVLDPETRERKGECVQITGADSGGCWARTVTFHRDVKAATVEWEEPQDFDGAMLGGGIPTIFRETVAW